MGFAQGEEKMENTVWHYTKMNVLEKIFPPKGSKEYNEGKIRLRFTNIRFLNDPSEGLVFRNFFKNHREEIANSLPKDSPENLREIILNEPITDDMMNLSSKYTFSTTYLEDSFAFWNKEYAGLNGVAIGFGEFDMYELENGNFIVEDINYVHIHGKEEEFIKDIAIMLDNSDILKYFGIEHISSPKEILSSIIDQLSCIYKQKSWEYEKEVRIIIDKASNTEIIFEGNNIKKCCYEYIDVSIVKYIVLGPECNDEQVKTVREYLDKNGYKDILVARSRAFELRN